MISARPSLVRRWRRRPQWMVDSPVRPDWPPVELGKKSIGDLLGNQERAGAYRRHE